MREGLQGLNGERLTFRGVFRRFGEKRGWQGRTEKTVLLSDITDAEGNPLTDHLWFNFTKSFERLALSGGDRVEFQARVTSYVKGYFGRREEIFWERSPEQDFKLSRPTRVRKIQILTETVSGLPKS